jgi:hypothetical protein
MNINGCILQHKGKCSIKEISIQASSKICCHIQVYKVQLEIHLRLELKYWCRVIVEMKSVKEEEESTVSIYIAVETVYCTLMNVASSAQNMWHKKSDPYTVLYRSHWLNWWQGSLSSGCSHCTSCAWKKKNTSFCNVHKTELCEGLFHVQPSKY